MAYAGSGGDIGSLRFLAANIIYQATSSLLRPDTGDEADRGVLDDASLMMDVVASYHTEKDDDFKTEWAGIMADRKKAEASLTRGMELDPSVVEAFRWRELRAMFRSLCRKGTFVRQDSPNAAWDPASLVKP